MLVLACRCEELVGCASPQGGVQVIQDRWRGSTPYGVGGRLIRGWPGRPARPATSQRRWRSRRTGCVGWRAAARGRVSRGSWKVRSLMSVVPQGPQGPQGSW